MKRVVNVLRFRTNHSSLLVATLLALILTLAFLLRILPMRWGTYLSEFDPYFQYRLTERIVEKGFASWACWHDYRSWYPSGRYMPVSSFPGLPLTAALFYWVSNALGLPITLLQLCVVFPALMAVLTCLVMYFLGKDFGGRNVGLFASLFLALNASYISRTSWGFFDDETVGIFALLLFTLFFLRSLDQNGTLNRSLGYSVLAGLSLGYLFASWGAARYPMGMAVLFAFVLVLLRKYSTRLLVSYSATFGMALFIAVNVPRLGIAFLTKSTVFTVPAVFVLLCACEIANHIETRRNKTLFAFGFLLVCAVGATVLWGFGYVEPIEPKYLLVLNPTTRTAFVQSVQEHRPSAWGTFYWDLGIGVFLVPVGLFFASKNLTNRNLFLIIFGLTSIYFASSMIRLTLLLAPAVSLLWALALVKLASPFITILNGNPLPPRRKKKYFSYVGKEFSVAALALLFLLLAFTLVLPAPRVFKQAYSPTTIASASVPLIPHDTTMDWIDALAWMREYLPHDAIVASWWDYGYWITVVGNKTSLADNGTINATSLQNMGYVFMSTEAEAVAMLRNYSATHILVFTTFDVNGRDVGFGDEGKWRWMARIASEQYSSINESDYGSFDENRDWHWSEKGLNCTLVKLMSYGKLTKLGRPVEELDSFKLAYLSRGQQIQGQVYALVCVYEIKYEP